MDELIAILLVIDILLRLWIWYLSSKKSPPLSSLEYHMTRDNPKEEIIKILYECSEETRRFIFEQIRKQAERDSIDDNSKRKEDG